MSQPHSRPRRSLLSLLEEASVEYTGEQSLETTDVSCVTDDSRQLEPGSLFVAVKGTLHDGHQFIPQAINAGASAMVLTDPRRIDQRVPCILVPNSKKALAKLSAAHAGLTALQTKQDMTVIGVTGTNGKTTTCHLIRNILKAAGHPTALLGTIQYDLVGRQLDALWTTPPAPLLAAYLIEAHGHGARHAIMEVSSHALDQHRTDGVRFDVAVFTNLSGDHLDYHRDIRSYFSAKKLLFDHLPETSTAVINADDAVSSDMVAGCAARVVRFGIDRPAGVLAKAIRCDIHSSRFMMVAGERECPISLPLIGRHNVSNALAAAGTAVALGIDLSTIQRALDNSRVVPGRLQRTAPDGNPFSVFVDYAHTDDALENVLSALRPLTRGRLWCVFGCGGDRDRAKRPRMAHVAARYADRVVVTSDNPRSEDPMMIINDILTGLDGRLDRVSVEQNRRRALQFALSNAEPQDIVLITGKGHEDYQLIGDQRLHFDDVEVVEEFFTTAQQFVEDGLTVSAVRPETA